MLLHDYLRRKEAILKKAKADIDNLLEEIAEVHTRKAVEEWKLGDPITDSYDVKQSKETAVDAKTTHVDDHIGSDAEIPVGNHSDASQAAGASESEADQPSSAPSSEEPAANASANTGDAQTNSPVPEVAKEEPAATA